MKWICTLQIMHCNLKKKELEKKSVSETHFFLKKKNSKISLKLQSEITKFVQNNEKKGQDYW